MAVYNTFCVVCGRFSNRSWNNTITVGSNTYVACDFHSLPDITQAATLANANSTVPDANVTEVDPSVDESAGS